MLLMPQLDLFSHFTQFFWFLHFFITFYLLLAKIALPLVSQILKIRHMLIFYDDLPIKQEQFLCYECKRFFLSVSNYSKSILLSNFKINNIWLNSCIVLIINIFSIVNSRLMYSIFQLMANKNLTISGFITKIGYQSIGELQALDYENLTIKQRYCCVVSMVKYLNRNL
jgi:hypothetical protein